MQPQPLFLISRPLWIPLFLIFPAFFWEVGDLAAPTSRWCLGTFVGLEPSASDILLFGAGGWPHWGHAVLGLAGSMHEAVSGPPAGHPVQSPLSRGPIPPESLITARTLEPTLEAFTPSQLLQT